MITRAEKKKNYTVLDNGFINDKTLSCAAVGLLARILSHKDNQDITKSYLMKKYNVSKDKLNTVFSELQQRGYIVSSQEKDGGKFTYSYDFYEDPLLLEDRCEYTAAELPLREIRDGKTAAENPHHINTIYTSTKETNTMLINTNITNTKKIKNKKSFFSFEDMSLDCTQTLPDGTPIYNILPFDEYAEYGDYLVAIGYEITEYSNGVFWVLDVNIKPANECLPHIEKAALPQKCTNIDENTRREKVCLETNTITYSNGASYRTELLKSELSPEEIELLTRTGYTELSSCLTFDLKPFLSPTIDERESGGTTPPKVKKLTEYEAHLTDGTVLSRKEYALHLTEEQKEWYKALGYEEKGNWLVIEKVL
jgi:hypothetical protein